MALPVSNIISVNVTRENRFPDRTGFSTPLIVTTESVAGVVDIDNRTKFYASLDEVVGDWAASTEPYKAAQSAFAQNPRPLGLKIGYTDGTANQTADDFITDINALTTADSDWYFMTITAEMRASAWEPNIGALVDWMETQNKLLLLDNNDSDTEDPTNTSNLAAVKKNTVQRTGVFYHRDPSVYMAIAVAVRMGANNFDAPNGHYTLKFVGLQAIAPVPLTSAEVRAITGWAKDTGQSATTGHCANTYVDYGGQNLIVEGSTLTPNVFLDEIHSTDWLSARTQEKILGIFTNNKRVPYTQIGLDMIAGAVKVILTLGQVNGIVAQDDANDSGEYQPGFTIDVPRVTTISPEQRAKRIAPPITAEFRFSGALHSATVNFNISF